MPKGTRLQQLEAVFRIPGTTSAWAAGNLFYPHEGSGGVVGAIWKDGR